MKQLCVILLVAFSIRVAAGVWWQARLDGQPNRTSRFGFGDSESYWALAETIARGEAYQYGSAEARVFRTPGYSVVLTPLFLMGGTNPPILWARVLSAALGTLAVGGVWWLGRWLFDQRTALVAAMMAAIYPGAITTGALVLSEAPFCPLMLMNLIGWIAAWKSPNVRHAVCWAIATGLVAAIATLVRPSWLMFVPFALTVGLIVGPSRLRHLGLGACMMSALIVGMMPWWIRNHRTVGHFVPTTLQVGASLYDGLHAEADGSSQMDFVPHFQAAERRDPSSIANDRSEPFEYRLDRRLRNAAITWARANPSQAIRLAGIKLVRMWNVWPNEATLSTWPVRAAIAITYLPVALLAAFGAFRTLRRGWPYLLCLLPAVYFTLLHVVFVSSIRYRQPALLCLMLFAASIFSSLLWKNRRRGRAANQ